MSAVMESPPRTLSSVFRPFPLPLTGRQWFYLTFLQGVGAGFIDGGANFGIAYAMYHGQSVVRMWVFSDNTIAGDLGVTPIIQCLASMLITSTLVHSDLHASSIKPLPYVYPHVEHLPDPRNLLSRSYRKQVRDTQAQSDEKPNQIATNKEKRGLAYYYWMLVRFIFEGTERNMLLARPGVKNWFGRFLWTAAQGAGVGIIFGFPIWCLAIVILGPIYGNGNMGNKWAPQVIKLVYGAIVGWVTNPVIAILALGSQADHHLIMVEHDEEESAEGESATNTAVDETIHENEEYTHQHYPSRSPVTPQTTLPPSPRTNTSPLVRPSIPTRARASSNLSTSSRHRPPLTANVSGLSPLPPASMDLPPERPTYGRERGLTVSSMGSQYSYALGGSGGRAKRPRAGTSASFAGSARQAVAVPQVMVSRPSQDVDTHAGAAAFDVSESRTRSESGDVFRGGSGATGPFTLSSPKRRTRSASAIAALGEVEELNQS